MYEQFFGLRERPFDLTPNPRFIYLSEYHLEALSVVHYGIVGRKGITLVVGEAGTGKTTIVRAALEAIAQPTARCVYVSFPMGLPINDNVGENEAEIRALLQRAGILAP